MIRNLQLVSLGRVLVAAAASERIRGMISSRVAIPPQYYAVLRTTLTYQLSVPCRPAGLRADDIFTSRNIRSWWIARRREGHYKVGWLLLVVYFTSTNTVWPLKDNDGIVIIMTVTCVSVSEVPKCRGTP